MSSPEPTPEPTTDPTPESKPAARPRGRRPSGTDARAAILEAARAQFAARGYDATSLRAIARQAEVDPALVHHYFDGKSELFAATLDVPVRPRELVERVVGSGPDGVGERLVRSFLGVWDTPAGRARLLALLRSMASHEDAARMLREFLTRELIGQVARRVGGADTDPERSAALAASQLVGLAMVRYVLLLEPLASAPVDDVVRDVAPTLQRYLTGT